MNDYKIIPGYPTYEISETTGRVRNILTGNSLQARPHSRTGYLIVHMRKEGKSSSVPVHQLLAETYLDEPQPGQIASLINGIKSDLRAANVVWRTLAEAIRDSFARGDRKSPKLNGESIKEILKLSAQGIPHGLIATKFEISRPWVCRIIKAAKKGDTKDDNWGGLK